MFIGYQFIIDMHSILYIVVYKFTF